MSESIRMSADALVVLLLSSSEHTTSESDARRLLAEVKNNHSAEQAAEIDRLRNELAATVKAKQENDERFQIAAAEQRDRAEKAEAELAALANQITDWRALDGGDL